MVPGGAERIMSFLAREINKEKFSPELVIAGYKKDTAYNVNGVKTIYLEKDRVLWSVASIFMYLIKNKPDIMVSSISHLNAIMGLLSIFFLKTKFIGREANIPSVVKNYNKRSNFLYPKIIKFSYHFLDIIICQSQDMLNDMGKVFSLKKKKLKLINNPVTDEFTLKTNNKKNKIPKFITVASFKKQKGHERIITALSKLNFDFVYTMVGDGTEKTNIFKLIDELDLKNKIVHVPFTKEVAKYLSDSDLFIQGSYVEGFPNCLLESCAVGTPIIAFQAPGGLNEIIEEGCNGYIAKNETEYIELIDKSCHQKKWNPIIVRNVVMKKFNKKKILLKYEKLFIDVLK